MMRFSSADICGGCAASGLASCAASGAANTNASVQANWRNEFMIRLLVASGRSLPSDDRTPGAHASTPRRAAHAGAAEPQDRAPGANQWLVSGLRGGRGRFVAIHGAGARLAAFHGRRDLMTMRRSNPRYLVLHGAIALALLCTTAAAATGVDWALANDPAAATEGKLAQLRAQVLLERAHFSPGEIDARSGSNVRRALNAYQASQGLP